MIRIDGNTHRLVTTTDGLIPKSECINLIILQICHQNVGKKTRANIHDPDRVATKVPSNHLYHSQQISEPLGMGMKVGSRLLVQVAFLIPTKKGY